MVKMSLVEDFRSAHADDGPGNLVTTLANISLADIASGNLELLLAKLSLPAAIIPLNPLIKIRLLSHEFYHWAVGNLFGMQVDPISIDPRIFSEAPAYAAPRVFQTAEVISELGVPAAVYAAEASPGINAIYSFAPMMIISFTGSALVEASTRANNRYLKKFLYYSGLSLACEPVVAFAPLIVDHAETDNYHVVKSLLDILNIDAVVDAAPLFLMTLGAAVVMYELGRKMSHGLFEAIVPAYEPTTNYAEIS
jgi:hypothetical protein